jgi:hypothetical protein
LLKNSKDHINKLEQELGIGMSIQLDIAAAAEADEQSGEN